MVSMEKAQERYTVSLVLARAVQSRSAAQGTSRGLAVEGCLSHVYSKGTDAQGTQSLSAIAGHYADL